jgi:nitrite reductase/ring-hydroxylating ferredoxin subunit
MAKTEWLLFESEDIGRLHRQPGNCMIEGKAGRRRICVARSADALYAFDAKCPHAGGPLVAGTLNEKKQVLCPWHRFAFDLETGQSESGGYVVKTYPVEQRGAQIWVEMPRRAFRWW